MTLPGFCTSRSNGNRGCGAVNRKLNLQFPVIGYHRVAFNCRFGTTAYWLLRL